MLLCAYRDQQRCATRSCCVHARRRDMPLRGLESWLPRVGNTRCCIWKGWRCSKKLTRRNYEGAKLLKTMVFRKRPCQWSWKTERRLKTPSRRASVLQLLKGSEVPTVEYSDSVLYKWLNQVRSNGVPVNDLSCLKPLKRVIKGVPRKCLLPHTTKSQGLQTYWKELCVVQGVVSITMAIC